MALIGTIRKNSWILVVMVGLGLGGFIIMDVSSAGGMGGQTQFNIGEVNDEPIAWDRFRSAQDALYTNSDIDIFQQREFVWRYMIEEKIVEEEAAKVGLKVGDDEMQELLYGGNVSPVVVRNFSDPATGQLNIEVLNEFRTASQQGTLSPQYQNVWDFQMEEVEKVRLQDKLINMVKKGIYTPTWMAEDIMDEVGSSIDFRYVLVPFAAVDDSEIEITEEDYKAYIEERRKQFELDEETRDASYTMFEVLPTAEDSLLLREKLEGIRAEFAQSENDSMFIVNLGNTYLPDYLKEGVLPPFLADTVFQMETGDIYGPYLDYTDATYKLAKVLDKKIVPDSVSARHILIGVERQEQVAVAFATADTVMNLLAEGVPFDSLAQRYSNDEGSKFNGGELGYAPEARYVKPFNDLLFHSDAELNTPYRIATEFGIHIVEILDRKYIENEEGVRLGIIAEPIIPSEATQDYLYDDVLEFAGLNRTTEALEEAAASDDRTDYETIKGLKRNDFAFGGFGASETSRSIIRWIFDSETKAGRVAPEIFVYQHPELYYNAAYVVVGVTGINKAGLPAPDQVMERIEDAVANRKKAEVIAERISGKGIPSIVGEYTMAETDTVKNTNFGVQVIQKIGDEPKVIGAASTLQMGDVSEPIIGQNGVYVIEITKVTQASAAQNIPRLRQQGSFQVAQAAETDLLEALREKAKITDNRSTYY